MKLSQAKYFADLLNQVSSGKTLQMKNGGRWHDVSPNDKFGFHFGAEDYRIKPEPKLRPWKPEEVPVGVLLKTKDTQSRWMLIGVNDVGEVFISGDKLRSLKWLFDNYDHSTDHGATWQPCGVQE